MTDLVTKNPIVKKIVEGNAKDEILDLLVGKQLPFTEEEYLESLVFALKIEKYKSRALDHLKQLSESTKLNYVEKSAANHRVAYYILLEALNWKNVKVIAKIIRNQSLPFEFLMKIAEKGDITMLEALLDNQIKLIAYPEIMDMMDQNPETNNFIRGKLKEIRDFYLRKENATEIPAEDVLDDVKTVLTMEHENSEDDDEDSMELLKLERKALTALQEINSMSISERVKLALAGSKSHRMILIKDANKMVALAVVESPKLTADEVILIARNKSIATDIIGKISRNREWVKNYAIVLELIHNPKTPVKDAVGFITKLHIQDLKLLAKDKNVNPVVRQVAFNYFAQKDTKK